MREEMEIRHTVGKKQLHSCNYQKTNFRKIIKPSVCVVGSFSWLKNILKIINERYSLDFSVAIDALTVSFQNVT